MNDFYHRRRPGVIGAGHNGLTAATVLARAGWEVDVYERSSHPGGATTSGELFGSGSIVDYGAAADPFGVASPIFRELELESTGLPRLTPNTPWHIHSMTHPQHSCTAQ